MSLIQALPGEAALLQEIFDWQTLHSGSEEAGVGGRELLFLSAALGWVDLKVAGVNATVIALMLCSTAGVGHCHMYGFWEVF